MMTLLEVDCLGAQVSLWQKESGGLAEWFTQGQALSLSH